MGAGGFKPFSQACENNRQPILEILKRVFRDRSRVLEIGSGTGQHAVYFAPALPHLTWQTSDLKENHPGINAWIDEAAASNLQRPLNLDVLASPWPRYRADGVFSANTCHIMPWQGVTALFEGLDSVLEDDAVVAIYGPFKYGGEFTTPSNARFDLWLREQYSHQGIRDFEAVNELAKAIGLQLVEDNAMPANNQLLVWRRT